MMYTKQLDAASSCTIQVEQRQAKTAYQHYWDIETPRSANFTCTTLDIPRLLNVPGVSCILIEAV